MGFHRNKVHGVTNPQSMDKRRNSTSGVSFDLTPAPFSNIIIQEQEQETTDQNIKRV